MQSSKGIDREALFCDETAEYRIPAEPKIGDRVKIRFRTARGGAETVALISGKKAVSMKKVSEEGPFDYYEADLTVGKRQVCYYFEIKNGQEVCTYGKLGADRDASRPAPFCLIPGFSTPKWAKGAVMYQIFTDRFCNGSPENDVLTDEYACGRLHSRRVEDWNSLPESLDVCRFYGGDLQGVEKKLDYLQELGVEVIYFNPLFVSPSNHKYDIQDYDHIDPHFAVLPEDHGALLPAGSTDNTKAERYIARVTSPENLEAGNRYFAELVEKIHKRGMKVILDGVFNHCGSFNKWLDHEKIYQGKAGFEPGAYVSESSPYQSFFNFKRKKDPDSYEGWWDYSTLPKLNYEKSPELCRYILEIGKKWVSPPYCADGWRLDVAADLGHSRRFNHHFWAEFRKEVKTANPDALILAEHYGDPSEWLQGEEWDTVMNYDAFMEPVSFFLTGMEKHSDSFRKDLYGNSEIFFQTMNVAMSHFSQCSLETAMNELSNHDHSRFLTRTNRRVGRLADAGSAAAGEGIDKAVLREAVILQMTLPGAPTLYYADEAGQVGWTDPDDRRTYPWGKEDMELVEFHRSAIAVHKTYDCLKTGSYLPLGGGSHWLAFARFNGRQQAVILVNNTKEDLSVQLPVWRAGIFGETEMIRVIQSTQQGYNIGRKAYAVSDGVLKAETGPQTATVWVCQSDGEDETGSVMFFTR